MTVSRSESENKMAEIASKSEIRIRTVKESDAGRISEIYRPYVENTAVTFEYVAPSPEEILSRIRKTVEKFPYVVAEKDGRVVGYAYAGVFKPRPAYDWSCELSIYVDRSMKRSGIGRMLYAELERRLALMGIRNACACVAYPNVPDEYSSFDSAHFHESMGYTKVAHFTKCAQKFGVWYDMIWLEKSLARHTKDAKPVCFGMNFDE